MSETTATVTDLRKVYSSAKEDEDLQVFVDLGNMVVNEQLHVSACTMSDARYKQIAVYLAAHFADVSSPESGEAAPIKIDKIGEASTTYAVPDQTRAGYNTTKWGQLAIALDTCNILMASPTLKARFQVVGDNHIGAGDPNGTDNIGTLP